MTSKRVIRESESPRPAVSSILISRMTRSSVIIPYLITMFNQNLTLPIWQNINKDKKHEIKIPNVLKNLPDIHMKKLNDDLKDIDIDKALDPNTWK